ncbi:MAG: FHA domain-containing protein [Clostridiales bacterium]|nr:FHA domain-containing protein [Clostridiales bacterium]
MDELISKITTYVFVVTIFSFILNIIRLIYSDIHTINRRFATGDVRAGAYLKLLNLREELYFDVEESYILEPRQTIGRAEDNAIAVKDPFLSKRHAKIYFLDGQYYLEDLGGKNGTLLNEAYIDSGTPCELADGDRLRVGQLNFMFVAGPPEAADEGEADDGWEADDDDDDADDRTL